MYSKGDVETHREWADDRLSNSVTFCNLSDTADVDDELTSAVNSYHTHISRSVPLPEFTARVHGPRTRPVNSGSVTDL